MLDTTQQRRAASDPAACRGDYCVGFSELESAIFATITYRDLFDYPLTALEIHRYLQGVRCGQEDVAAALADSSFAATYLTGDGEFFALKGRDSLFELRRDRAKKSLPLWARARRYGTVLSNLPFVRMVAVTGSLAVENPGEDADIDFMLVTDGGRLWSVRLLAKVLQALDARFGSGELCVNHLISTRALPLDTPGNYVAQELCQMVPLYGADVYSSLRKSNGWAEEFLPNAIAAPPIDRRCDVRLPRLKRLLEFILRSPFGNALESWESGRKLEKYNRSSFLLGRSTPFRAEATGHRKTSRRSIETAFADRLRRPWSRAGTLRVLMGQSYHMHRDRKLYKAMQPFPPLGCLYGAGVVRALGHDVWVHDSMLAHSVSEWATAIQLNDPDVVVLYEDNFNYLTKMCLLTMRDAAFEMVRCAKARNATVLVCGSDSADEPERYLRAGADYVLIGEGEETLAELIRLIGGDAPNESSGTPRSDRTPLDIMGLAFLDDDGAMVRTARRPVARRLDDLPLPAWDLIDLERYAEVWTRRHGRSALNMVTTRGCPYHCNWCAKPIWGQRYNARTPEHVVDELEWLRELTDVDYVWFMDDIFGLKPGWIERFGELLQARGIGIQFKCLSRPDLLLREGETKALASAGCDIVWMGAESGSQNVLDAMEKGTTVEMIHDASNALRDQGVRVGLFIQFGYPGETREDIQRTIEMIRAIMPEELGISVSYPLPGTRFYERVKTELGQVRHWQDSDDLAMLFRGPFNTSFYRALHRYVHYDLAMRKALLKPNSARKIAAVSYHLFARTAAGISMAVFSRMPHEALNAIPGEMDTQSAATPTEQPRD